MAGSSALGFVSCLIAVFGFGTNYLPVKKVEAGDGVFFACCMALGIWLVGLLVDHTLASKHHDFEPAAMIGGALWMCGNLLTPVVIRKLGMGLSLATWGLSDMLAGWATGHFGLFGVNKEVVKQSWMNYLGVAMAAISIVLFAQAGDPPAEESSSAREISPSAAGVCPEEAAAAHAATSQDLEKPLATPLATASDEGAGPTAPAAPVAGAPGLGTSESTRASDCSTRGPPASGFSPTGFALAIIAGVLFGSNFDPTTVLQQEGHDGERHSTHCMDYVVSHFTGILATAGAAMLAYLAAMRRRSYLNPRLILPAMLSGAIWAVAQTAWFQANAALSFVITFPIVTTLPGLISIAWGVLLFGEFRTWRSRTFAFAALCTQIPGVVLIALSKS